MHLNHPFEPLAQEMLYETPVAVLFSLETEDMFAKSNVEQIIDDEDEEDFDW